MIKWYLAFIGIILIYVLGYVNGCRSVKCPEIVAQVEKKEIKPTFEVTSVTPAVEPVKVLRKKYAKKVHIVDTSFYAPEPVCDELLRDYYSKKYFSTQYMDSAINITVTDSISENSIIYRKVDYLRLNMMQPPAVVKKQTWALCATGFVNSIAGPGVGGDFELNRLRVGVSWFPFNRSVTGSVGYVLFRR